MNNNDIFNINKINEYILNDDEKNLLSILNELFSDKKYKDNLQFTFSLISSTEMYGYLSYLSDEEIDLFLTWDNSKSHAYFGKSIRYYNKGQLSLLYEFEQNKKVFLSAPTSFGKTSIVMDFISKNFSGFKNILFIVPTNSLLEELYIKASKLNKSIKMDYIISTQPLLKNEKRNFLLLTPERFFLASESYPIDVFDLIVMDETYKIVESKNERISDFLNSRSLRFRKVADMIGKSEHRVLFLSPFTYKLTDSMEKFLKKYNIRKIDRKYEYVSRDIIKITNFSEFTKIFKESKGYKKKLKINDKTNILLNELSTEKNIIYVPSYSRAYEIVDGLENKNDNKERSKRFSCFIEHLEKNYDIGINHEWKVLTALKKGVGIYVGPIPRYIKKEIVKLYENNEIQSLIVTTAFTEGVNTNASNLIFTSLVNGPNSNKLSDIDILNVSGRAGRFSMNSIGKIYCVDEKVYKQVEELQNSANIQLINYNYEIGNKNDSRCDYEIEMIEEEYLTEEEKIKKEEISKEIEQLSLTKKELNVSLCVPTKWKLILYRELNTENIGKIYNACLNITNKESEKRKESLNIIFNFIRNAFNKYPLIDVFQSKPYEIKAFDNSGNFIWGRLYDIYSVGKTKDVIKRNMIYIRSEYNNLIEQGNCKNKEDIETVFKENNKSWILNKYYDKNFKINYDAFFTETFKFISEIIQYKIPFYVSFVVSIVKLYIQKHDNIGGEIDINKLDVKKIASFFEDGSADVQYEPLLDFGISNDIILKLVENNITIENLKNREFDENIFDKYELMTLEDFLNLM